eukprot:TRINITY_DN3363_c0_g1_i1.p1 TRINITY_DN3363_c0_g1~~TRINITY_DN3363_c0_g1_i1.p1  ORF type:complete len:454 (-),score=81.03 TRINITY_DN3363_c0_g1_i1:75-1436(-)
MILTCRGTSSVIRRGALPLCVPRSRPNGPRKLVMLRHYTMPAGGKPTEPDPQGGSPADPFESPSQGAVNPGEKQHQHQHQHLHEGHGHIIHDRLSTFQKKKLRERIKESLQTMKQEKASEAASTAVTIALCGNVINTIGKFLAYLYTGSNSMLSEALHSTADVANQTLLFVGVKRSKRPPTQEYPYGFEGERFVYALISATSIFFLGACFSIYHGIYHILHPSELENLGWAMASLSLSACIESISFSRGVIAVRKGAKENDMTFFEYLKKGSDPMGVAVVMEDGAALVGLFIAGGSLGMSYITGSTLYDALGSVLIGTLLAYIAGFLIVKNARSLSTRSVPQQKKATLIQFLKQDPIVQSLHDVKAVQIGVEAISLSASIEFDGEAVAKKFLEKNPHIVEDLITHKEDPEAIQRIMVSYGTQIVSYLGDEVDRIEQELKAKAPEVKFVDLESN